MMRHLESDVDDNVMNCQIIKVPFDQYSKFSLPFLYRVSADVTDSRQDRSGMCLKP